MKIDKNLKNGLPEIKFDNTDIMDLAKVCEMFKGEYTCQCGSPVINKAWDIFKKYLECEKIKLEFETEMSVSLNRIAENETRVQVAKSVGFKHFLNMEDKIKLRLQKLRENLTLKEEVNEPNEYGD